MVYWGTCPFDITVAYTQDHCVPNLSKQRQDPALLALGAEIKRLRLEREMTQEALAFAAGVERSYVGYVERGDNNVAFLTLQKLATALEISVSELVANAGL